MRLALSLAAIFNNYCGQNQNNMSSKNVNSFKTKKTMAVSKVRGTWSLWNWDIRCFIGIWEAAIICWSLLIAWFRPNLN